jgi:hypothetical protein
VEHPECPEHDSGTMHRCPLPVEHTMTTGVPPGLFPSLAWKAAFLDSNSWTPAPDRERRLARQAEPPAEADTLYQGLHSERGAYRPVAFRPALNEIPQPVLRLIGDLPATDEDLVDWFTTAPDTRFRPSPGITAIVRAARDATQPATSERTDETQ